MANFTEGLERLSFYQENQTPVESVQTKHGVILFTMYGETTEFRVRTLFTKEPETISWIDTFKPSEVFWDIGANIGCYSLYAAKKKVIVQAFEPSPANFWLLARNVAINNFDRIATYPFALADRNGLFFWEPSVLAGSAGNQLLKAGKISCVQAYQIDELVKHPGVEFPNHIKLDVDGIERLILEGGADTLSDRRVRSIMCEVNEGDGHETDIIVEFLASKGFGPPLTRHPPYYDQSHYAPWFNYLFIK